MSGADDLLALARKAKANEQEGHTKIMNQLESYKASTSKLFDQIEMWLEPLTSEGLVTLKRWTPEICDDSIPKTELQFYSIDHLDIQATKKAARLKPAGLYFIGCWDVIDLTITGSPGEISLSRPAKDGLFTFAKNNKGSVRTEIELNKDSFSELIKPLFS